MKLTLRDALVQRLVLRPSLCQATSWEQRERHTESDPLCVGRDEPHQGLRCWVPAPGREQTAVLNSTRSGEGEPRELAWVGRAFSSPPSSLLSLQTYFRAS